MPELQPGESASPSARWARRFGGQDRSLAQRTRHNEDIRAFAQDLQRQREEHQAEELRTNKEARDLYFRQREMDWKEQLDRKDLQRDTEMHEARLKNMEASRRASAALTRERIAREISINEKAEREANSRTEVFKQWSALNADATLKPGTPDYAKRTLDILIQHGGALDAGTRKMLTDTAKVTTASDPAEAADQAIAGWEALHSSMKEKGINATVTGTLLPSGRMGFKLANPTPPRSTTANPQLKALQQGLAQAEVKESMADAEAKPAVQSSIASLQNKIAGATNPTGSTSGAGMGDVKNVGTDPAAPATPAPTRRKIIRAADGSLSYAP